MAKILHTLFLLLLLTQYAWAQSVPPSTLSGESLKVWLRENWYNGYHKTLGYDGSQGARGYMYSYVDNYDGKVTCIYTGYQELKAFSATGGSTAMTNINCEHTVPQSFFGKSDPMVSDIHHLFPTHSKPNGTRSNYPFSDINDAVTTTWHVGDSKGYYTTATIPTVNIDSYSESYSNTFEPREDHKGNTARAIFYFFTMYPTQAGSITSVGNINTLYQWHLQDPVDDRERERNNRVQAVQGNRNPYIDYPELVAKAWGLVPVVCEPTIQLSNLAISEVTTTTFKVSWAKGSGDKRLVVVRENEAVNFTPTGSYTGINSNYSLATDQGSGHRIVYSSTGDSVVVRGLSANKTYHVQVFEFCSSGNKYNTTAAPSLATTTSDYTCSGIPLAITGLNSASITQTGFTLNWANGSGDGRMVVLKKDNPVTFVPANGEAFTGANANYTLAAALADGSRLVYNGSGNSTQIIGLIAGSTYYAQVFESCSNGYTYQITNAPVLEIKTADATQVPTPGNGNLLALQDFDGTASDGWVVTSGFSSSAINTGLPNGQRLRSGSSLQTANATRELIFSDVNVAGKQDVYFELYNSSVSVTTGNGFDAGDYLEVYVALDGANFSATPDIRITANATDNNIRYGMDGTATITTAAGTLVEKIFTEKLSTGNILSADNAPSILRVTIPNGTTTVKAKVSIKNNSSNEIWNVEDVALFGVSPAVDCDADPLEDFAGADKVVCNGASITIGAPAVTSYTYQWSTATGLSGAALANPTFTASTPGTYTYTVTATNGTCTYSDDVVITVSAAPQAPVATAATTCAGASAVLEITNPDASLTYNWYASETGETLLGTGANFTTPQLTANTAYYVGAATAAGCLSALTKVTVDVSTAPDAPTINGPSTICAGETVIYSATMQPGVIAYNWSVPASWVITSGAGTPQIAVQAGNDAGEVSLAVANNCGPSAVTVLAVTVTLPVSNNTISAAQAVCAGQVPATITGTMPTGGTGSYTYLWETSADGNSFIPAAGVNNARDYTPGQLSATTFIRRSITSGNCGTSISEAVKVTVNPVPDKPAITQTTNQLTASIAGAAYEWAKDGITITDAISQSITITESGNYTVRVRNGEGCYSASSEPIAAVLQPTGIADAIEKLGLTIYPNPSHGKVFIAAKQPLMHVEVIVANAVGHMVYRQKLPVLQGQQELDLTHLSTGVYLLRIVSDKGQASSKLFIVD
ncbi:endonuclease [Pontibacter vulgaris]|uniref:endonuclease n=1 Tax=Pontibacter vulgaris TaxID=2905679 RepID=UPI001FA7B8E9|nr:endonuclease [Pontibacter vulgaris]